MYMHSLVNISPRAGRRVQAASGGNRPYSAPVLLIILFHLLALLVVVSARRDENAKGGPEIHPILLSMSSTTSDQAATQSRSGAQPAVPQLLMNSLARTRGGAASARTTSGPIAAGAAADVNGATINSAKATAGDDGDSAVQEIRLRATLAPKADKAAVKDLLDSLGASSVSIRDGVVYCWMPTTSITSLSTKTAGYINAWHPNPAMPQAGIVTSQGDLAMRTDLVRAQLGLNGSGIKVGILSDSFNSLGGAQADMDSGDLPPTVQVLKDITSGSDEGRAMAQIVYDVAPGAAIAFYTAFVSQEDFADGIVALQEAGCDVIVDDIVYFAEPFFLDGVIARAVDLVKSRGVAYFSAALNFARQGYDAPFRSSGVNRVNFGTLHNFDKRQGMSATKQKITVGSGGGFYILQWNQLFYSEGPTAGVAPGATSDVDVYFRQNDEIVNWGGGGNNLLQYGGTGDPIEIVYLYQGTYDVEIILYAGQAPSHMWVVVVGDISFDTQSTDSGTVYGHALAAGAVAVGAAFAYDTPWNGVNPPLVEYFSSRGGMPVYYDANGGYISGGTVRQKPDLVGPDGGDTTFFGQVIWTDSNSYPNFFGTSAAAPHVAGLAALMLQYKPSLTPDEVSGGTSR
eukprot:jgi/Mesvir1/18635/Mv17142-RA.3